MFDGDRHRLIHVAAAQGLIERPVLGVVVGNGLKGENLVAHGDPLGVAAHLVDLVVDRHQQRVLGAQRKAAVKLLVAVGEGLGGTARGL